MFSSLFSLPIVASDDTGVALRGDDCRAPETFFAGPENALVRSLHAAARAEFASCNPIVLYGPAGAGKSTIAHSLTAIRRERFELKNIIVMTAADLTRALAHAVDTASVADFRTRFHRCDLLFIDDLHRLKGKPAAQQFLLPAMDALVHRGSMVIVTMRQAPHQTPGLTPQLISRLTGGLVTRLALPGPLARREIVQQAAARVRLPLADEQIARLACCGEAGDNGYVTAARLRKTVLALAAESDFGATKKAHAETADLASNCRRVIVAVARHFGLKLSELKGKSRRQTIAEARSLAMFLIRRQTGASYAEIGRQFGNRDHTTVLHSCHKMARITLSDDYLRRLADDLAAQLASETVP